MSPSGRLSGLQAVRAVAALAVVWAHCEGVLERLTETQIRHSHHFGTLGVDVFFALSGFVMASTAPRAASAWGFLGARLKRIVPLYFLLSLTWLAISLWHRDAVEWRAALANGLFWPIWGAKFVFPMLGAGWTLSFEMLFYSLVALGLLGGRLAVIGILVACAASMAAWLLGGHGAVNFLGHPLLLEFAAGWLVARYWRPIKPAYSLALIAIVLAVLAAQIWLGLAWIHDAPAVLLKPMWAWRRMAWWGPLAVTILIAGLTIEPLMRGRVAAILVYLGNASYSIYLFSAFPLFAIEAWGRAVPKPAILPMAFAACVLGGVTCYELVEKPLRAIGSRPLPTSARYGLSSRS